MSFAIWLFFHVHPAQCHGIYTMANEVNAQQKKMLCFCYYVRFDSKVQNGTGMLIK